MEFFQHRKLTLHVYEIEAGCKMSSVNVYVDEYNAS